HRPSRFNPSMTLPRIVRAVTQGNPKRGSNVVDLSGRWDKRRHVRRGEQLSFCPEFPYGKNDDALFVRRAWPRMRGLLRTNVRFWPKRAFAQPYLKLQQPLRVAVRDLCLVGVAQR